MRRAGLAGLLTLILAIGGVARPAAAWDADGHTLVGAIADRILETRHPSVAAKVKARLGMNLGAAAVWLDCVKGVRKMKDSGRFEYRHNPIYAECEPFKEGDEKRRMESYVERNHRQIADCADECHKEYHYTDVSVRRTRYEAGAPGTHGHDVVQAIGAALAKLAGKPTATGIDIADEREALLMLAHLVGDIHQPLHVGAIYLDAKGAPFDPATAEQARAANNRGGNDLVLEAEQRRLVTGNSRIDDLHGLWDDERSPTSAAAFGKLMALAGGVRPSRGASAGWAAAWATESLALAGRAYGPFRFGEARCNAAGQKCKWPVLAVDEPPPFRYRAFITDAQNRQIATAGARLAQLMVAVAR